MSTKKNYITIFVLITIFLFVFLSCDSDSPTQKRTFTPQILLTANQLEKYGFEHINNEHFSLYFLGNTTYLLNYEDCNIIRIESSGRVRQYKAKGQGPSEFLGAYSFFMVDNNTIGVFDLRKSAVLMFDVKLNYLDESKLNPAIEKISHIPGQNRFVVFGNFTNALFGQTDKTFKIQETFIEPNRKSPFKLRNKFILNKGYMLADGLVAHTAWMYLERNCHANIYRAQTKELICTLKWEQGRTPTQADYDNRKNIYGCFNIGKCGKYFVVCAVFSPTFKSSDINDLLIFDQTGSLLYRDSEFPYDFISAQNSPEPRIFFLNENDDLAYFSIKHLLKSNGSAI